MHSVILSTVLYSAALTMLNETFSVIFKHRAKEEGEATVEKRQKIKKKYEQVVVRKIEGKLRLRLQLCIFIIISQFLL